MNKNSRTDFSLLVREANGTQREHRIVRNADIAAVQGAAYAVLDTSTGRAPQGLRFLKDGHKLRIVQEGEEEDLIQIHDFFNDASLVSESTFTGAAIEVAQLGKPEGLVQGKQAVESVGGGTAKWFTSSTFIFGASTAGGIALLVNANNDDEDPVAPTPSTLTVTPVAGKFVEDSDATLQVFNAAGELIAEGTYDGVTGQFTALLPVGFTGPVLVIVNGGDTELDYQDEATGDDVALEGTELRAIGFASGGNLSITVSPLTELAVRLAGVPSPEVFAGDEFSLNDVVSNGSVPANEAIADLFGVDNILGPATTVLEAGFNTANGTNAAEQYGLVLAQLSGADAVSGGLDDTLDVLEDGLVEGENGALSLDSTAQNLLDAGREEFNDSDAAEEVGAIAAPVQDSVSVIVNNDGVFIDQNGDGVLDALDDSDADEDGVQFETADLSRGGNADLQGHQVTVHFEGIRDDGEGGTIAVNLNGFGSDDRIVFDMVQLGASLGLGGRFAGVLTDIDASEDTISYSFRGGYISIDHTDYSISLVDFGGPNYELATWNDKFNYLSDYLNFTGNTEYLNAGEGEGPVSFEFAPLHLIATQNGVFVDQNQDGVLNAQDRLQFFDGLALDRVDLVEELDDNAVILTVQGLPEGEALDVSNFGADDRLILDLGGLAARGIIPDGAAAAIDDVFTAVVNGVDRLNYTLAGGNTALIFRPSQARVQLFDFAADQGRDLLVWNTDTANALEDFDGFEDDTAALNDGTGEGLVAFRFPVEQPDVRVIVNTDGAFLDKNGDGKLDAADYIAPRIPDFEAADFSAGGNADFAANNVTIEFEDVLSDSLLDLTGFDANDRIVLDLVRLAQNGVIVRGAVDDGEAELGLGVNITTYGRQIEFANYQAPSLEVNVSNGVIRALNDGGDTYVNLARFTDGSLNALGNFGDVGDHAQADEAGNPLVSFIRSREINVIANEDGAFIDANGDGVLGMNETTVANFGIGGNADLFESVNILVKAVPDAPLNLTGFGNDDSIVLDLLALNGNSPNLAAVADFNRVAAPQEGRTIDLRGLAANLIVTRDGAFNDTDFNNIIDGEEGAVAVTVNEALLDSGSVRIEFRDIPQLPLSLIGFGLEDRIVINLAALVENGVYTSEAGDEIDSATVSGGPFNFAYYAFTTNSNIQAIKFGLGANVVGLTFRNAPSTSGFAQLATWGNDDALDVAANYEDDRAALNANMGEGLVSFLFTGVDYNVVSDAGGGSADDRPEYTLFNGNQLVVNTDDMGNGSLELVAPAPQELRGEFIDLRRYDANLIVTRDGVFNDTNFNNVIDDATESTVPVNSALLGENTVRIEFRDAPGEVLDLTGFGADDRLVFNLDALSSLYSNEAIASITDTSTRTRSSQAAVFEYSFTGTDSTYFGEITFLLLGQQISFSNTNSGPRVAVWNDAGNALGLLDNYERDLDLLNANTGEGVVSFLFSGVTYTVIGKDTTMGGGSDNVIPTGIIATFGDAEDNALANANEHNGNVADLNAGESEGVIGFVSNLGDTLNVIVTNDGAFIDENRDGTLQTHETVAADLSEGGNADLTAHSVTVEFEGQLKDPINLNGFGDDDRVVLDLPRLAANGVIPVAAAAGDVELGNLIAPVLGDDGAIRYDAPEVAAVAYGGELALNVGEGGSGKVGPVFGDYDLVILAEAGAFHMDANMNGVLDEGDTDFNFETGIFGDQSVLISVRDLNAFSGSININGFGTDDRISLDLTALGVGEITQINRADFDGGFSDYVSFYVNREAVGRADLEIFTQSEAGVGTIGRLGDQGLIKLFTWMQDDGNPFNKPIANIASADALFNGTGEGPLTFAFGDAVPQEPLVLATFDDLGNALGDAAAHEAAFDAGNPLVSFIFAQDIAVIVNADGAFIDADADGVLDLDETTVADFGQGGSADLANRVDILVQGLPVEALDLTGFGSDDTLTLDLEALVANGDLAEDVLRGVDNAVATEDGDIAYTLANGSQLAVNVDGGNGELVLQAPEIRYIDLEGFDFNVIVEGEGAFIDENFDNVADASERISIGDLNSDLDGEAGDPGSLSGNTYRIEFREVPSNPLLLNGFGTDDRLVFNLAALADPVFGATSIPSITDTYTAGNNFIEYSFRDFVRSGGEVTFDLNDSYIQFSTSTGNPDVAVWTDSGNALANPLNYELDLDLLNANMGGGLVSFLFSGITYVVGQAPDMPVEGEGPRVIATFGDAERNALADADEHDLDAEALNAGESDGVIGFIVPPPAPREISIIVTFNGAFIDEDANGYLGVNETIKADFADEMAEGYVNLARDAVTIEVEGLPFDNLLPAPLNLTGFGEDDRLILDLPRLAADGVLSGAAVADGVTRVRVQGAMGMTDAVTYSLGERRFEFQFTDEGVRFSDSSDTTVPAIATFTDGDVNALADFANLERSLTDINGNAAEGPVSFVVPPAVRTFDVSVIVNGMGAFIDANGDGMLDAGELGAVQVDFEDEEAGTYVDLANQSVRIEFEDVPEDALNLNGFGSDDLIVFDLAALDANEAFENNLRDTGLVSVTTTYTDNFDDDGILAEGVRYNFGGEAEPVIGLFKTEEGEGVLYVSSYMDGGSLAFWSDTDNALNDAANLATDVRDLNNGVAEGAISFEYEPVSFLLTEEPVGP